MKAIGAIAESLANIEKSLLSIASSSPGWNDFLSWIVPAFAGAFAAYLFNYFHWQMVEKRQVKSNLSTALCDCIKELEDASVKYWLTASDSNSQIESKQIEISIKSQLTIMRAHISRLGKSDNESETVSTLDEFSDEIYDLITGGEFESTSRPESPNIASKISKKCTKARALLSEL